VDAGRPATEQAAVVEWGTTAMQRSVVGTLDTIADVVDREGIRPPATTIVGPVVGLRDAVTWFESRPLFGRTVVVTRPPTEEDRLQQALAELGARVLHVPVIEVVDPPSFEALDRALVELPRFEWIAFSSPNAVRKVFERLDSVGRDARALAPVEVAAVGEATAAELARRGIVADVVPDHATGAAMTGALGSGGGRVLLPRPLDAPRELPDALSALGWEVVEVAAYETRPIEDPGPHVEHVLSDGYDVVAFASPSAVDAFVDRFGAPTGDVACIGSTTAAAATRRGLTVALTPARHGADALAQAIADHLRK
jgi:uroporphyrinogen III methyltransferase/synthase